MPGYRRYIKESMASAREALAALRRYAWDRRRRDWGEYREYIVVLAFVTITMAVGLRLLHPFVADTLNNVMNSIADSL